MVSQRDRKEIIKGYESGICTDKAVSPERYGMTIAAMYDLKFLNSDAARKPLIKFRRKFILGVTLTIQLLKAMPELGQDVSGFKGLMRYDCQGRRVSIFYMRNGCNIVVIRILDFNDA